MKKIVIQIELKKGGIESYDHVIAALHATVGTLSDSSEPLSTYESQDVGIFDVGGQYVGVFTITNDPMGFEAATPHSQYTVLPKDTI